MKSVAWLGLVTFQKADEIGTLNYLQCDVAVYASSQRDFAEKVRDELRTRGYILDWYENIGTAIHFSSMGQMKPSWGALARSVQPHKLVSFGNVKVVENQNLLNWNGLKAKWLDYLFVFSPSDEPEFYQALIEHQVPLTTLYTFRGSNIPGTVVFYGRHSSMLVSDIPEVASLVALPKDTAKTQELLDYIANVGFSASRPFHSRDTLNFAHHKIMDQYSSVNYLNCGLGVTPNLYLPCDMDGERTWRGKTIEIPDIENTEWMDGIISDIFREQFLFLGQHLLMEIYMQEIPDFSFARNPDYAEALYGWPDTRRFYRCQGFVAHHLEHTIKLAQQYFATGSVECNYRDLSRLIRIGARVRDGGKMLISDPTLENIWGAKEMATSTKIDLLEYTYIVKPSNGGLAPPGTSV